MIVPVKVGNRGLRDPLEESEASHGQSRERDTREDTELRTRVTATNPDSRSGIAKLPCEEPDALMWACPDLVRQANWQKVGGESPPKRRSNQSTFLREPCAGSREGAGEASVAVRMGGANEQRKDNDSGCRGFQIGRRQHHMHRFGEMQAGPAVSENPCTSARLLSGPWEVFKPPRKLWRGRVGKGKTEACDVRFEEVGWGHMTCEGGEQGGVSFCGVAGGKGLNQGESGLPKHVPNTESGKRATGGNPDTGSLLARPAACRQSPEVGAGWINVHVRICAGGAQQCAFLPRRAPGELAEGRG